MTGMGRSRGAVGPCSAVVSPESGATKVRWGSAPRSPVVASAVDGGFRLDDEVVKIGRVGRRLAAGTGTQRVLAIGRTGRE